MYVATPQGYRRKIGPRSRYGTTSDEPAYRRSPQRVGSEPQRVGTNNSGLDAHFGSDAMRRRKELDEREQADRYLAEKEKRRANQARKREDAQRTEAKTARVSTATASNLAAGATGGGAAAQLSGAIGAFMDSQRATNDRDTRAKQAAADRAKARERYEAEKSGGKAPEPAVAAKKPEPRKEAVMPATHAPPAKPTVAKAAPAKDDQPSKKAPANGFSPDFHETFKPTQPSQAPEPQKLAEKPKPKPVPGKVQVARAVDKVVKGTKYAATLPLRNAVHSATAPIRAAKAATDFVSSKVDAAKRWWETGE